MDCDPGARIPDRHQEIRSRRHGQDQVLSVSLLPGTLVGRPALGLCRRGARAHVFAAGPGRRYLDAGDDRRLVDRGAIGAAGPCPPPAAPPTSSTAGRRPSLRPETLARSLSLGNSAGSGTIQTTGGSLAVSGTTVTSGTSLSATPAGGISPSRAGQLPSAMTRRWPRFREHGSLRP